MTRDFWRGRRVLVTGHTGFKGAWLALWLESLGAEVTGLALKPATAPNLFEALAPYPGVETIIGDLREREVALAALGQSDAEIVFHLAAQSLVRQSYSQPVETLATNVLGTAHLLEAVRQTPAVKVVVVVTSDKVYANDGRGEAFCEDAPLGGSDPYSASKACQEIIAAAYGRSFFSGGATRVASARAGNVIGGGDWAADRLVPDFVRAAGAGAPVALRHPDATRPWQHVLDSLAGYLSYAERLHAGKDVPAALNFGPAASEVRPVRWVVERLARHWGEGSGWIQDPSVGPSEAHALTLDSSLAERALGWRPRLHLEQALEWTVAWYRAHREERDMRSYSMGELRRYRELAP